jgi:hypothetical protein
MMKKRIVSVCLQTFGALTRHKISFPINADFTPQFQQNIRLISTSPMRSRENVKLPKSVEISLKGVVGAENAVRAAEMAVTDAENVLKMANKRVQQKEYLLDKWVEANADFTGEEPTYKALRVELESARAGLDSARISLDSARSSLDSARAYHLSLNGAGE